MLMRTDLQWLLKYFVTGAANNNVSFFSFSKYIRIPPRRPLNSIAAYIKHGNFGNIRATSATREIGKLGATWQLRQHRGNLVTWQLRGNIATSGQLLQLGNFAISATSVQSRIFGNLGASPATWERGNFGDFEATWQLRQLRGNSCNLGTWQFRKLRGNLATSEVSRVGQDPATHQQPRPPRTHDPLTTRPIQTSLSDHGVRSLRQHAQRHRLGRVPAVPTW